MRTCDHPKPAEELPVCPRCIIDGYTNATGIPCLSHPAPFQWGIWTVVGRETQGGRILIAVDEPHKVIMPAPDSWDRLQDAYKDRLIVRCTAWDLLGDHYDSLGETHHVRLAGGRTWYEGAFVSNGRSGERVRLARVEYSGDADAEWDIRQINRYVDPETPVELVPIEEIDYV